ncbi:MAG TPA: hypothetical protein PK177_00145 [Burkholderiaceae bacterium]|nr:hypothetical protein [Burkholderiaceae bacterium]
MLVAPTTRLVKARQAILYRARFDVVWPQFAAIFAIAQRRFRKTIARKAGRLR